MFQLATFLWMVYRHILDFYLNLYCNCASTMTVVLADFVQCFCYVRRSSLSFKFNQYILNYYWFLQRVHIARNAERCTS